MNKEASKKTVAELVEKFRLAEQSGAVKKYTEADTKKNFIEPLFSALGWPIDTDEVRMEETISGDRVDYGFYIDGRIQFYLEAKAVKADLNDEKFAHQAIKYSWNKGVAWAVLTDFEDVKIFNAQDVHASLASKRFKTIHWDEYVERFDELWLLSRAAWQEKLLDAEAEKSGKKLERVSVTSKLYEDLNEARALLSDAFLTWNKDLRANPVLLDEGVQKVLDRIIFIRVAEDRGIEPQTLRPLVREWYANWYDRQKRDKYLYQSMEEKFRELDGIYNSSIFAPHPSDNWVDEKNSLQDIAEKLYGKEGYYEYDFKAMPADVLGTVYEQYLGHRLAKAAKGDLFGTSDIGVAKDARKRKEQGIYYTPRFIVDYIVENALGPVLAKCDSFADLEKIKVLDPACGSGSFLIKALELIYKKYEEFGRKGQFVKLQILSENLYGVDLDEQAVEIARLNLLIAALETRMKMPNLDNIRVGNSLISGTDEELNKQFGKDWRDKRPFNWQQEFPEVFKHGGFDVIIGNPPYIKEFVNKSAFDGLHESPYYQGKMDLWTMFACISIDLLKDAGVMSFIAPNNWISNSGASIFRDKILTDGKLSQFIDFGDYKVFEQAGIQTMIYVFDKKKPSSKYSVEYLRIADTNVTEEKLASDISKKKQKIEIEPTKLIGGNIVFTTSISDAVLEKMLQHAQLRLGDDDLTQGIVPNPDVVNSRNIAKIPQKELAKYGIKVKDGVFVIPKGSLKVSKGEEEYLKPLYDTGEIDRYLFDPNNQSELIYIPKKEKPDANSAILKHLDKFRPIMEERRENLSGSIKYYNLHWPRNQRYFLKGPKIISLRKCKRPTFTYTEEECYVMLTFNVIKSEKFNLKYLTAVLNSTAVHFWLKEKGKLQGDQLQIDTEPLQQVPIPKPDQKTEDSLATLTDKMLDLNKKLAEETKDSEKWKKLKTEIDRTDKEIDAEVYKLYGLTPEEIKVVEAD